MTSSADHREFTRIPVQNKVKVSGGKGRLALYVIAINLSLGGVLLSATPSLQVGSTCQVTLFDGDSPVLASGRVVRSDAGGTAIQFAKALPAAACQALVDNGHHAMNGLLGSYLTYFQVGRNDDNAGCEKLLGVSKRTFRTVFYSTYATCIPAAIVPVWLARASIQSFPVWEKIAACFLYGAIWLMLIQPTLDIGILAILRKRKTSRVSAKA